MSNFAETFSWIDFVFTHPETRPNSQHLWRDLNILNSNIRILSKLAIIKHLYLNQLSFHLFHADEMLEVEASGLWLIPSMRLDGMEYSRMCKTSLMNLKSAIYSLWRGILKNVKWTHTKTYDKHLHGPVDHLETCGFFLISIMISGLLD